MSAVSPVSGGAAAERADDVAPDISFRVRFTWGVGSLATITYLNIVTALVLVYLTTVLKNRPASPAPSSRPRASSMRSAIR